MAEAALKIKVGTFINTLAGIFPAVARPAGFDRPVSMRCFFIIIIITPVMYNVAKEVL